MDDGRDISGYNIIYTTPRLGYKIIQIIHCIVDEILRDAI